MATQDILITIGDKVGSIMSWIINYLSSQTPAKIISLILLAGISFIAVKYIVAPALKWTLIILSLFLIISTGYSLFI